MESSNLVLKQRRTSTTTPAAPSPESPTQNGVMDSDDDEEGPFFDLEVTILQENFGDGTEESKAGDDDKELNFILTSPENNKFPSSRPPSDDIFSKIRISPVKPKPEFYVSDKKRATSFRIWTLGNRKLKPPKKEQNFLPKQSKCFVTANDGDVPIFVGEDFAGVFASEDKTGSSNSKDVAHKYFRKIKPLYFRVSKMYAEKFRLFVEEKGQDKAEEPAGKTGEKCQKPAMPARLRLACKKLGKSKSASSAISSASSLRRRDDSALLQQDGIQSAIAHCKKSFNAVSEETGSMLQRSKSDSAAASEL